MRLTIVVLLSGLEDIRDHILFIFLNLSQSLNLKIYPWPCHSVVDIRQVLGVFM